MTPPALLNTPSCLNKVFSSASALHVHNCYYYSTNCNTIQIWSWCSRYLSFVGSRYPAIYVALQVGRKSEVKKCQQKDLKMLRAVLLSICWIKNNYLAQSHGMSSDFSRLSLWPRRLSIGRYSTRFCRIIVKYSCSWNRNIWRYSRRKHSAV